MSVNRRRFIKATGAAVIAAPCILREGFAQTPAQMLKLAWADTKLSPAIPATQQFCDTIKKLTDGALNVQIYGLGELGSQANILTSLQTGIVDFCAHTTGYVDTVFPRFQALDLPFVFPNEATAEKVVDGPIGKELMADMPAKGIEGLGFGYWGWRVVSTVNKPVPSPNDMRNIKIRVQPGAIYASTFRALGANPVAIDYAEVYLALSQHAIDAIEIPLSSLHTMKANEVVKFVNLTNQVYNPSIVMASKRKFDALEKKHQEAIRTAMQQLTIDWRQAMKKATIDNGEAMKKQGLQIVDVDREAYRRQTEPVYAEFRDVIGSDLVSRLLKAVA